MSSQTHNRWYIVPSEEITDESTGETEIRPKYSDKAGIEGFSGSTIDESDLGSYYSVLTQIQPDKTWYIVRFYGTVEALNSISTHEDAQSLATNTEDVLDVLSRRLPEISTNPELASKFKTHK